MIGPLGGISRQELADDQILLRTRQQPGRRIARHHGGTAQQAERVGRERAHHGLRRRSRAGDASLDASPEGLCRPAAEREDEDPLWIDPFGDPGDDRLHQRGRLAGARRPTHQQRAAVVRDDLPLHGIKGR
jgi:hypothetical protein